MSGNAGYASAYLGFSVSWQLWTFCTFHVEIVYALMLNLMHLVCQALCTATVCTSVFSKGEVHPKHTGTLR